MERSIIVIDDFYDNPDEVRNFGVTTDYPHPGTEYTYPGKNSDLGFYNADTHKKMESIVGAGLEPSDPCGYFRISFEHDSFKQDVHVDPGWDWGGVLYMNTPEQCIDEGGTSFWKHNSLHWEKCPRTSEESQYYSYPSYKEAWKTTVYGAGLDRNQWTRYMLCPMKYNRLVLFRTHLWHSHNYNFGDSMENGRLVQLFFFKEKGNTDNKW
jgi:hypothetical protein